MTPPSPSIGERSRMGLALVFAGADSGDRAALITAGFVRSCPVSGERPSYRFGIGLGDGNT